MKTKALSLFVLLSFLFVSSCKNEKDIEEDITPLMWYSSTATVGWEAGSTNNALLAYSKTEWEIFFENPVDWCSINVQKGTGRQNTTFTFELNTTTEQRQVAVHARNINDETEHTVFEITQRANPAELRISPTSFFLSADATNCSINVNSSLNDWTVEVNYIPKSWERHPWCTLTTVRELRNSLIVASIKENPDEMKRAAVITVRLGNVVARNTIFQSANVLSDEVGVEINGVTWATRNVGAYSLFAPNFYENYGRYYQYNSWVYFPNNEDISIGKNPYDLEVMVGGYDRRMLWSPLEDPSPEGWRIPTKEELDALVRSGYRWVRQEDSYIGCAGAWAGPNAETATFDNPGKAIFLPALGIMSTDENSTESYKNRGAYHATGMVSGWIPQALHITETGFDSPLNTGVNPDWAISIRCVKK